MPARFLYMLLRTRKLRRIKLLLEYEGTRYHGWQLQVNQVSIQGVLEKKLHKITGEKIRVIGSGRTDAGVHAEGQVAHFQTNSTMKLDEFLKAMNSLLPSDIVVKKVAEAKPDFHAQISATRKTYRYTILNRDHPSALQSRHGALHRHPDPERHRHAQGGAVPDRKARLQNVPGFRLYRPFHPARALPAVHRERG